MKLNSICQVILLCAVSLRVSAQGQIITPDDQPLSFQVASGTNNLLISQGSTYNTFIGRGAGQVNTTGAQNTFLGYQSGLAANASSNTFLGYQSGFKTTSGGGNVFVGSQAGFSNTIGTGNLFLGQQAGGNNTTGSYNLFMGNAAGGNTIGGTGNTSIGDGAGFSNSSGSNNTNVGRYAGYNMTTGSNNTFIGVGASAPVSANTISNAGAIGYNAQVTISNALVLGNNVNVGIGNTAPQNKLEITQGTTGSSGLRFTNLTSAYTTTVLNKTRFLTVNEQGDVILASINGSGSGRLGAESEGFWQASGNQLQNTNSGGVIIGQGVSKTPVGYKLFVEEGILTEKVKVAIKSSSEWSDKVFEKDYRLQSLGEVERHIQQRGHLPGVPSAAEVVEQGLDLGRMDAKLLEKIEELTLHMISMEKRMNQLAKENQLLKRKNTRIVNRLQAQFQKSK